MKTIATHKQPDADALVSSWLAARFLFEGERVRVEFVSRHYIVHQPPRHDCVVDVARTHDPVRLVFDHKPPAFRDRNTTCATWLIWDHLLAIGKPVEHLAGLVEVVHEGDRRPPSRPSAALAESRSHGLHAFIKRRRALDEDDQQLFRPVRRWLNRFDRTWFQSR